MLLTQNVTETRPFAEFEVVTTASPFASVGALVIASFPSVPEKSPLTGVLAQLVVETAHHDKPFFRDWIEVSYPPGESNTLGPTIIWMRAPPLLADEDPSPFQSICPLADCGNGTSGNANLDYGTFVNPDLTIILHRLPETEWHALSAVSLWGPSGIGLSQRTLFDEKGPVGVASQMLLIQPV